ncbi:MAG: catalase [Sandaracinaceae bacterium]
MKKEKLGQGGEPQQRAASLEGAITTDQGVPISDNQNSLKAGMRGPTLLEDHILREKITRFDHERIPERVVHARGYGAHGFFQPYGSHARITRAAFLQDPKVKTPVFVRFSTVAGSRGSSDLARDVRGFAIKFYTSEGNYDLVGNNIPVFFIQDAIKFPDLIHSVKPERDRDFPQAQSAHDTFWDFVSLSPESTHMLMWVMSDRAIPRSFRMMEGFGVHTFRFVTKSGKWSFVKLHLRPKLGSQSVLWDEALKINGADPDFHRKDLWTAIERGDFPEWEVSAQVFDQTKADTFDFDPLDATKLVPEELVPLTPLGRLVLDRNVDEFFAETEQVAFCPSHVVPGIDLTEDPLLQGRLFSYLDTQLSRLGSPNFAQIPVNAPKCPVHNFARGGHMQMRVPENARASYEPNSIDDGAMRAHDKGFASVGVEVSGEKVRRRADTFADHYSQARLFWKSQTEVEQRHIVEAFAFELGNVKETAIRKRMLGRLKLVDERLCREVEERLGMKGQAEKLEPAMPVLDPDPSPPLSILKKLPATLEGRTIGVLVGDGTNAKLVDAIRKAAKKAGAVCEVVAPKVSGLPSIDVDHALQAGPSVLFDAVVVAADLATDPGAIAWAFDAYRHLKIIGYTSDAEGLLERAGVDVASDGVVEVTASSVKSFIDEAKTHRVWDREV